MSSASYRTEALQSLVLGAAANDLSLLSIPSPRAGMLPRDWGGAEPHVA